MDGRVRHGGPWPQDSAGPGYSIRGMDWGTVELEPEVRD